MKCPNCGYVPKRGAPRKFDHDEAVALVRSGMSNREVARQLGVSEAAIRAALKGGKKR